MQRNVSVGAAADLGTEDIHDVLRNGRRRRVLDIVRTADGPVSARDLSERIATIESGEDPAPRDLRQSVYVSLLQTHLPKLDELGIVDYQPEGHQVRVGEGLGEVAVYLESVPRYGIAWAEYYALVSLLGAVTVVGAELGTPVLDSVSPGAWALGFFALIFISGVYHVSRQRSSLLHRLLA